MYTLPFSALRNTMLPRLQQYVFAFLLAASVTALPAEAQPVEQASMATEQIQENGLYGNFYFPEGQPDLPAVIVIGGSECGIGFADAFGPALTDSGFATLALPYHNYFATTTTRTFPRH